MIKTVNLRPHFLKLVLGVLVPAILFTNFACESGSDKKNENTTPNTETDQTTEIQTQPLKVDSEAVDIFRGSMDFLSKLTEFSVQAQSTLEDIHETGHRVDFEIASSVIVSRPDKLRGERYGDLYNQIFYYNGSTLTLYNPVQKVYATEDAPGTIEEMLHFARDTYGIGAPVSDLIYTNAFSLLIDEVEHAELIGKVMIGDVQCDHLLFCRPGVDFQIWIADEGDPLPFKYVVTDTSTPELLAYSTIMRNWNIDPDVSDAIFDFNPPKGCHKIDFLEVE